MRHEATESHVSPSVFTILLSRLSYRPLTGMEISPHPILKYSATEGIIEFSLHHFKDHLFETISVISRQQQLWKATKCQSTPPIFRSSIILGMFGYTVFTSIMVTIVRFFFLCFFLLLLLPPPPPPPLFRIIRLLPLSRTIGIVFRLSRSNLHLQSFYRRFGNAIFASMMIAIFKLFLCDTWDTTLNHSSPPVLTFYWVPIFCRSWSSLHLHTFV